ncbi:hypothetical protein NC652_000419 [Populus alba x Populus x berolinensis]|nr:hypothetical protein NC652_000419 [Populus alba x Populus x berolinensis]
MCHLFKKYMRGAVLAPQPSQKVVCERT